MSIYYVSNSGLDTNDGLTPETAWQSVAKVNESIAGGDEIRFRCGDTFYGRVQAKPGTPDKFTTFTSYGEGVKPVMSQYKLIKKGVWEKHDENIYKLDLTDTTKYGGNTKDIDTNAGFMMVDGKIKYRKMFLMEELQENWDFYCDDQYIYVYLDKSPDEAADDIKIACCINCMPFTSYMKVTNLVFTGTGAHGISGTSYGAYIADCEFHKIGGSRLGGVERRGRFNRTRYGNGVEAWSNSHDITVERCRFSDIYDVAITMQGNNVQINWENCFFRNNVIWNCTQAFEIWSRGEIPDRGFINCIFENNVCIDSGYCWGYEARPNKGCATHLLIYGLEIELCDVIVRNNVFSRAQIADHFVYDTYRAKAPVSYKIYDNLFLDVNGKPFALKGQCTDEELAEYEALIREKNDVYSIEEYLI